MSLTTIVPLFIRLTRSYEDRAHYVNANDIADMSSFIDASGAGVTHVLTSTAVVGYFVTETPEEILALIQVAAHPGESELRAAVLAARDLLAALLFVTVAAPAVYAFVITVLLLARE